MKSVGVKLVSYMLIIFSLYSCASSRVGVKGVKHSLPPVLSVNKILKNVDTADLKFEYLNIKKVDVDLNDGERSFKASLKMKYDEFIQISINAPLGIEVIRLLLKQDSFAMINYHEKYYVCGDYGDFSDKYGIELGYDVLQSVFTNKLIIPEISENHANVKLDKREVNSYYLYSEGINRRSKRNHKRNEENSTLQYGNIVNATTFKVLYNFIKDIDNNSNLQVFYSNSNGQDVTKFDFPSDVMILLNYNDKIIKAELEYSKLEFDIPVKISFKIPSKYPQKDF